VLRDPPLIEISFTAKFENDTLVIEYRSDKKDDEYYISCAITINDILTKVKNGENKGRSLVNDHVVIAFKTISELELKGAFIISSDEIHDGSEKFKIIVFVQEKRTRKIIGAYALDWPE